MEPSPYELKAVLARLDARIDWERADRGALRLDLGPVRDLVARLGHPERAARVVHVAGTKGKGSVAALIAAGLRAAGRRVGLYASPHVERVQERVRIDGREVEDEALARALAAALDVVESAEGPAAAATWFDLMTAAAFLVLREAGAGWEVIEVGLGGRLDSTNVVAPELTLVTSIDLEHTDVLGDTPAAIAREKAGILKPGVPLVCGVAPESPAGRVVAGRARELGCPVHWVDPEPDLAGTNQALAAAALGVLGLDPALLGDPAVRAAAALPGRLERARLGDVPVVLDGAHVASSVRAVLRDLAGDPTLRGPCVAVLGLGRDKDAAGVLKALAERVDRVHCTSVGARQRPARELAALAADLGLESVAHASPEGAVAAAAADARGGWVLVTGSLHLIGAVRGGVVTSEPPR